MIFHSNFVEHCKKSHSLPDICCPNPGYEFTIEELKALYKLFEHQYIPYDDELGHAVTRKIMLILKEYELAQRVNIPT